MELKKSIDEKDISKTKYFEGYRNGVVFALTEFQNIILQYLDDYPSEISNMIGLLDKMSKSIVDKVNSK
jgi:hypothetical protein